MRSTIALHISLTMSSNTSSNSVTDVETVKKKARTTEVVPADGEAVAFTQTQVTETTTVAPGGVAEAIAVASTTVTQGDPVVTTPTVADGVTEE